MLGHAEIIFSVLLGLFIISCLIICRTILKSTDARKRIKYGDPKLKNCGTEIEDEAIFMLRIHYNIDEK